MGFNQAPALPYRNLGIVEDGDTASQAIEKDKYIIWKGQNYFAKTDILQGETFVVDTNLTAMPEGVINGIVDTLNASIAHYTDISNLISVWSGRDVIDHIDARKYDNGLVTIDIVAHYTSNVTTGNTGTFILDSSLVPAYTSGIGFMVSTSVSDGFLSGTGNVELSFNHPALNSGQRFYVSCKWKL